MKNPYDVLGMNSEATEEELKERYDELRNKYSEQRFKAGAEGNEGARKLSELEAAWSQITAELNKKKEAETFGDGDYGAIDDLIKKGSYDEAQTRLDAITDRSARWHYLQSIIYYKREWLSDSRKQLALAVEMDPGNEKYKTALEKLDMVMGSTTSDPRYVRMDNTPPPAPQPDNGQVCGGNAMSNCCLAYCLTDCCCTMMRCC